MTSREPYPNLASSRVESTFAESTSPLSAPHNRVLERRRRRSDRTRVVRIACTIVNILCGLFAVVLVSRIVLVIGEANSANGVASFVRGFSSAVSLGFDDLFTPDSVKFQVLLNSGLAAIAWLAFGALVTTLIRRLALPDSGEVVR